MQVARALASAGCCQSSESFGCFLGAGLPIAMEVRGPGASVAPEPLTSPATADAGRRSEAEVWGQLSTHAHHRNILPGGICVGPIIMYEKHNHQERDQAGGLNSIALSATLHCLTGCALGEIAGMVIGTAAGLSNGATIMLSVALAFVFGYSLTSWPLLRAGLALAVVAPIAFASDTASIA